MRWMCRFHHFTRGLFAVHFYFHTETDVRTTDTDGQEFGTYGEARVEAIRTCGQLMKDAPEVFWGSRPWSVTVTDKSGLILWEIYLDGQTAPAARNAEPSAPAKDSSEDLKRILGPK